MTGPSSSPSRGTDGPWLEARRGSKAHGLGFVGGDFLLLGLARSGGVAGEILAELGASDAAILSVIEPIHASAFDPELTERSEPAATPSARRALQRAEQLAAESGAREEPAHLLLALAYDRHGVHAAVMRALGIDRRLVVERLAARGVAVPVVPPPPDPAPKSDSITLPREQAEVLTKTLSRLSATGGARFVDEWGDGRWGFGADPNDPALTRIVAEPRVRLDEIAAEALASAGYPVRASLE